MLPPRIRPGLCLAPLLLALLPACDRLPPGGLFPPGAVDASWWEGRKTDYLEYVTSELQPGSVMNVIAHLERDRVDPGYTAPVGAVHLEDWQEIFDKIANLEDTSDFDVLRFLNLVYGYAGHPMIDEAVWQQVEDTILGFKFWHTQPTPEGIVDDMWYWTENHQAIFHACEYLAGQLYPDRTFTVTGMTGTEHMEHARPFLEDWLDIRARFGFMEWHSNVYYKQTLNPMLTLAEFADDREFATKAAMMVDLLLFDLGMHTFRGSFGATHGRSYKKDKMTALDEDTFNTTKLLFDRTEYDYRGKGDNFPMLLVRAQRYEIPAVVLEAAWTTVPFVDRERMGIQIDEHEPRRKRKPPVAPYGFEYDEEHLPIWWSMNALTVWQPLAFTLQVMDKYDLWEGELFAPYRPFRPYVENPAFLQELSQQYASATALALLKEMDSYTFRTADYMLSSVQDYRKGGRGNQIHTWQATFDPNAEVFTNHPAEPPRETTDWGADGDPGYWTGTASIPRIAQHENVAILIYSIQYPELAAPADVLSYFEPYTHAYFPQDHFDEVVQEGSWTFGRFREGYIGLYSWRDTEWVEYDPEVISTNGMVQPFDLKAPGGPQNVWIVELGSESQWGSFSAFRAAVAGSSVSVTPSDVVAENGTNTVQFEVAYDSPSQGLLELGWEGPLRVDGEDVAITGFRRYDNPWSQVEFQDMDKLVYDEATGTGFAHDWGRVSRMVFTVP